MSSSERFSSGESDDESLPDLQKLKPYDLEPEILSLDGISTSSDEEELSSSDCEAESRIGKTYSYYYQHHCFNNKTKAKHKSSKSLFHLVSTRYLFGFRVTFISRFDTFILCFYNSTLLKKFTFTNSLFSQIHQSN